MNCPKCNYDMFEIYNKVIDTGQNSEYCKIKNIRPSRTCDYGGTDWEVECVCPRCKTEFSFIDGDY